MFLHKLLGVADYVFKQNQKWVSWFSSDKESFPDETKFKKNVFLTENRLCLNSSMVIIVFGVLNSGSKSLVNVVNVRNRPFFRGVEKEEKGDDEDFDVFPHQPGKKRRLTSEQVQFLESNFEVENKLEPERKVQLAKELGMQPRQVAIWFQNRRARFKTKQLEKDYGMLKAGYDILRRDYDNLVQENDKLKEEVTMVRHR